MRLRGRGYRAPAPCLALCAFGQLKHRNVAEQQSTIAELKTTVARQQKQIEALTATVQKVSDQIVLSKPAPQLVANP